MGESGTPRPSRIQETLAPGSSAAGQSGGAGGAGAEAGLLAGKRIGKYQITRLLGRGGMGAVYEARDLTLDRRVALKILPREVSENDEALKRFVREARLAARLNHPNAVGVYEVGRKGTIYYIAMELVVGRSGQDLLEDRGPLDAREATRSVADACRALVAAHAAGLIHRDIKPGNLLWADDGGTVKLSDFGLAKPTENVDVALTQRDSFVGTPLYMSPEQARNDALDGRSDLYSLGATYFTLLTGQAPYRQGSAMQILMAHCSAPIPDVREKLPSLPAGCGAIVATAMAKDPASRYPNAAAMLADLQMLLDEFDGKTSGSWGKGAAGVGPIAKQPAEATSVDRRWLLLGVAAVVVLLVGGGVTAWMIAGGGGSAATEQRATNADVAPAAPATPVSPSRTPTVDPRTPSDPRREMERRETDGRELDRRPPRRDRPSVGLTDEPPADEFAGEPGGDIDGASRDPLLREYREAREWLVTAVTSRDHAAKTRGAKSLAMWAKFLADSPRPAHRRLAEQAKAAAEEALPGVTSQSISESDVGPGGPPLPPTPERLRGGRPGAGGPGNGDFSGPSDGPGSRDSRRPPPPR